MKRNKYIAIGILLLSLAGITALAITNYRQLRTSVFRSHQRWAQRISDEIQIERKSATFWLENFKGEAPRTIRTQLFTHPAFGGAYWFDSATHEFERWMQPSMEGLLKVPDPRLIVAQLKAAETQATQMGPYLMLNGTLYASVAQPIDPRHVLVVLVKSTKVTDILEKEAHWAHVHAFAYDLEYRPLFTQGSMDSLAPVLSSTLQRAAGGEKTGYVPLSRRESLKWLASFHVVPDLDWIVILAEPVSWAYIPFFLFIASFFALLFLCMMPWEAANVLRRAREAADLKQFAYRVDNFVRGKDLMLGEPPYPFRELTPIVQSVRWLLPQWKKAEAYPKELGLERKLLSLLIESLPEGILFFNAQGLLQLGNELGKVFFSLQQEPGREYKLVNGCQIPRGFLEPFADPVFSGQQKNLGKEVEVSWADGKHLYRVWVECVEVDSIVEGYIVVVRDITFRKQWEYVQEQVLSGITHDLRGPLSAIMGYLDLLKRQLKEGPPKAVEYVGLAREAGVRLTQMISDILDVVRFEQGKIDLSIASISVEEMFQHIQNIFGVTAGQKNITLKIDVPQPGLQVSGDPKMLERILDNLIGNAIKFTPSGGTVTVSSNRKKDRVTFSVSDTGRGIPKEAQSRIFDKFQQVRPGDRSAGYGLGLAVAKFIVEAHKGELRVESEVDKGSSFTFWIPDQPLSASGPSSLQS